MGLIHPLVTYIIILPCFPLCCLLLVGNFPIKIWKANTFKSFLRLYFARIPTRSYLLTLAIWL